MMLKRLKMMQSRMKGEYENTLNSAKNQAADIVKDAKSIFSTHPSYLLCIIFSLFSII